MTWPVVYYRAPNGSQPVEEFLSALSDHDYAIIEGQIERLEIFGSRLPFPHSSHVEGGLRELRAHVGATHFRFLYGRSGNLFVLLHALAKASRELPRGDIAVAKERWADFKARMNAKPRVRPRAAGKDF